MRRPRPRLGALLGASILCTACDEGQQRAMPLGQMETALSGTLLWESKSPSVSPPARMAHAFVYDPVRQVAIAAGGRAVSDTGDSLGDTWAWDGQSWTAQAASLPNRGYIAGTFDLMRQVTVMYGGVDAPFGSTQYFAQTLQRASGNWSVTSGTVPTARSTAAIAYDASRNVTELFGGYNPVTTTDWLDDLWEWNGSSWTQRCASFPCNTYRPSRRESAVFVYDAARGVTVLFGGWGDNQLHDDTWIWDGSAWTELQPSSSPSARTRSAAAYDPATQRVYLFGGVTGAGVDQELGDLWSWDGSSWELVAASAPASARRDLGMAWDTTRRRGLLFGGRLDNQAVDFWEFSLTGNTCASDDECHNGVCRSTVCADPLPQSDSGVALPDGGAGGTSALPDADSGGSAGTSSEVPGAGGTTNETPGPPPPDDPVVTPDNVSDPRSLYSCTTSPAGRPSSPAGLLGLIALLSLRRRSR